MRFVFSLLVDLWLVVLWPLLALRRRRAAPRGAWLCLEVDGAVVEVPPRLPFWDRRPRPLALQRLRRLVELAARDARVAGLLVELKHLAGGSATARSLRDVLLQARERGLRVVAYLPHGAGTRELYVASAAERVLLGPETFISALGYAVESQYFKDALDRVGIEPEVFARGRYKTAGEMFVERSMSEAQREQLDALLDVAWDTLIDALSTGRGVERGIAEQWINSGPWSADAALSQRIADAIVYDDQLAELLEPGRKGGAPMTPAGRYLRRRRIAWRPLRRRPRIGVVEVHGPIVGKPAFGLFPVAAEEPVRDAFKQAYDDPRVRGVIVHIDSPGGSALASDRMLHELRRLAAKKPVVACMGNVAASGGYMIAVGAPTIVAQPTTITGSIGVVAARFVVGPVLERVGIGVDVIKRGARADMEAPLRHLDAGEREVMERQLDDVYRSFLRVVSVGRRRPVQEIEPLAGGRVWSGRDALERGLVDRLGGFEAALTELRARIGRGAERFEPELVSAHRLSAPTALLPRLLGSAMRLPGTVGLFGFAPLALSAARERVWMWCGVEEFDLGGR